jgi:hypothetical protein
VASFHLIQLTKSQLPNLVERTQATVPTPGVPLPLSMDPKTLSKVMEGPTRDFKQALQGVKTAIEQAKEKGVGSVAQGMLDSVGAAAANDAKKVSDGWEWCRYTARHQGSFLEGSLAFLGCTFIPGYEPPAPPLPPDGTSAPDGLAVPPKGIATPPSEEMKKSPLLSGSLRRSTAADRPIAFVDEEWCIARYDKALAQCEKDTQPNSPERIACLTGASQTYLDCLNEIPKP